MKRKRAIVYTQAKEATWINNLLEAPQVMGEMARNFQEIEL